jgi:hypothetical protein
MATTAAFTKEAITTTTWRAIATNPRRRWIGRTTTATTTMELPESDVGPDLLLVNVAVL